MERDWSKASPELAWALSALVTVIAVILGGIYSWHRRRNAQKTEESVQVQWPTVAEKEDEDETKESEEEDTRDPIEFCNHIPSEIRKTTQKVAMKKIEEDMSEDQKKEEREIQRQQLEAIFKLMAEQEDRFGIKNMDDMQEQMKLYTM